MRTTLVSSDGPSNQVEEVVNRLVSVVGRLSDPSCSIKEREGRMEELREIGGSTTTSMGEAIGFLVHSRSVTDFYRGICHNRRSVDAGERLCDNIRSRTISPTSRDGGPQSSDPGRCYEVTSPNLLYTSLTLLSLDAGVSHLTLPMEVVTSKPLKTL